MIVIGKALLTEERVAILQTGTVCALTSTDVVLRFFLGNGPGVDLLATESVDEDGTRFLMGRVRFHVDDKVFSKEDHKEIVQVACGPEVPEPQWQDCVRRVTRDVPCGFGVRAESIKPFKVNGTREEFLEVFKKEAVEFGFAVSFATFDEPEGGEA